MSWWEENGLREPQRQPGEVDWEPKLVEIDQWMKGAVRATGPDGQPLPSRTTTWLQSYGFLSHPKKRDSGEKIRGVMLPTEAGDVVIASEMADAAPDIGEGQSVQYDHEGNYMVCRTDEGIESKAVKGKARLESEDDDVEIEASGTLKDVKVSATDDVDIDAAGDIDLDSAGNTAINAAGAGGVNIQSGTMGVARVGDPVGVGGAGQLDALLALIIADLATLFSAVNTNAGVIAGLITAVNLAHGSPPGAPIYSGTPTSPGAVTAAWTPGTVYGEIVGGSTKAKCG